MLGYDITIGNLKYHTKHLKTIHVLNLNLFHFASFVNQRVNMLSSNFILSFYPAAAWYTHRDDENLTELIRITFYMDLFLFIRNSNKLLISREHYYSQPHIVN